MTAESERTSASSDDIRRRDLALRPRVRVGDALAAVPGLFVVQHAGGGKAYQYFLRGFDADHGSDVAMFVDGVPINMPTHAHGQGWIDPHFLIPELITGISASKGPYVARYGDFATAGAIDVRLADHAHESSATLQGGSFGSARAVVLFAPDLGDDWKTMLAGEVATANGPFVNPERFRKYNLFGRVTRLFPRSSLALTVMSYAGRWNASGQLPLRAMANDPFGAIDPTDGGHTERHQLSGSYRYREGAHEVNALAYAVRYRFQLFSNFTFFAGDPVNGDQIAQTDARTLGGAHFFYRYTRGAFATTVGLQGRHDEIGNGLFASTARVLRTTTTADRVSHTGLGAYLEEDARLLPFLRAVLGLRADRYDVRVRGKRRDDALLVSPKLAVVLSPARFIDLFLNYGRGFHSNDARGAVTLLAPADSFEAGTRVRGQRVELSAAVFRIDLASEMVWVGDAGTTEPKGPTRRLGAELGVRLKLAEFLFADADATFVRPRFLSGEPIPLAPTRTLTAGLAFKHRSGAFGSVRVRAIAARPAGDGLTAEGFTIVDASAGYRYRAFELALDVQNVLNSRWREVQFANASRLRGEREPQTDIHFTPGWPLTALLRLTAYY